MKFHQVEVDDDVFQLVKEHAEPLIDSFNTAIRRLLNVDGTTKLLQRHTSPVGVNESIPPGTPKALAQVLEVASLVVRSNWSRTDATREIAQKRKVKPQTVSDKYGRQLGFTADEFDRLLGQPGLHDLKKLLDGRFPKYRDLIAKWLA